MHNDVFEINIVELMRQVLKKWWMIVLAVLIASGASFYYTVTSIAPVYQANTVLYVGRQTSGDKEVPVDLVDLQLSNQLITDYKMLLQSNMIIRKVIWDLSLDLDPAVLRGNLDVMAVDNSRIMSIYYKDTDPQRAAKIVNKISDVLNEKAVQVVGFSNVSIVDYASTPTYPISPSLVTNIVLAGLAGFMIAFGIIVISLFTNNKIQAEEDVERQLGLLVLGVIPRFKGEDRV